LFWRLIATDPFDRDRDRCAGEPSIEVDLRAARGAPMAKNRRVVLTVVDPTASAHPSIDRAAGLARHEPVHIELSGRALTPRDDPNRMFV
jgi:hypothetical protein